MINEIAYAHIFFFVAVILVHVLVPEAFAVFCIYMYIGTIIFEIVGMTLENRMMVKISFWLQTLLLVVIYITIMSDDWCRFYLYRGHA